MNTPPAERSRRSAIRQRLSEDERRTQIISATIAVVARHGFDGASATMIAERAGVSKGLIWHYFRDKNDLMRQTVLAAAGSILAEDAAQEEPAATVPDKIHARIRRAARLLKTHADDYKAMDLIIHSLRAPDGKLAFTLDDYEGIYQELEALFQRGQMDGALRPFNTRVMAVTYQGAIDMMLAYLASHPEIDHDTYTDALTDILLAAMAVRRDAG